MLLGVLPEGGENLVNRGTRRRVQPCRGRCGDLGHDPSIFSPAFGTVVGAKIDPATLNPASRGVGTFMKSIRGNEAFRARHEETPEGVNGEIPVNQVPASPLRTPEGKRNSFSRWVLDSGQSRG